MIDMKMLKFLVYRIALHQKGDDQRLRILAKKWQIILFFAFFCFLLSLLMKNYNLKKSEPNMFDNVCGQQ